LSQGRRRSGSRSITSLDRGVTRDLIASVTAAADRRLSRNGELDLS
jgi:hypothetical protein